MFKNLLFVLLSLTSSLVLADGIDKAERAYFDLWSSNNSAGAEPLLHTDYHYIGADGERHNRVWTVDMIGSGRLVYESVEINSGSQSRQGDVLVRMGTLRAPGSFDGQSFVDNLAFTMVWVRTGNDWQLLAEHNTRTKIR